MKIIYEPYQEIYIITLEDKETLTYVNTRDIVDAREEFIKYMTRLFNDTVCEKLKN